LALQRVILICLYSCISTATPAVCVHARARIYTYMYIYLYIYTYMHTYIYIHTHTYIYMYIYIYMYVCVRVCSFCLFSCACVSAWRQVRDAIPHFVPINMLLVLVLWIRDCAPISVYWY
jgi:hypothetical protein